MLPIETKFWAPGYFPKDEILGHAAGLFRPGEWKTAQSRLYPSGYSGRAFPGAEAVLGKPAGRRGLSRAIRGTIAFYFKVAAL